MGCLGSWGATGCELLLNVFTEGFSAGADSAEGATELGQFESADDTLVEMEVSCADFGATVATF